MARMNWGRWSTKMVAGIPPFCFPENHAPSFYVDPAFFFSWAYIDFMVCFVLQNTAQMAVNTQLEEKSERPMKREGVQPPSYSWNENGVAVLQTSVRHRYKSWQYQIMVRVSHTARDNVTWYRYASEQTCHTGQNKDECLSNSAITLD